MSPCADGGGGNPGVLRGLRHRLAGAKALDHSMTILIEAERYAYSSSLTKSPRLKASIARRRISMFSCDIPPVSRRRKWGGPAGRG
jgi:hypothetical protein